eukprot:403342530
MKDTIQMQKVMSSKKEASPTKNAKANQKLEYATLYEFRKRVSAIVDQSNKLSLNNIPNPQGEILKCFKVMMTDLCMIISQKNFFKICDDLREEFNYPLQTELKDKSKGLLKEEDLQQIKDYFTYQIKKVQTSHSTHIGVVNELMQKMEEQKSCCISPEKTTRILQAQSNQDIEAFAIGNGGFNEFAIVAQTSTNQDGNQELKKDVEKIQDSQSLILEELSKLKDMMCLQTFKNQNLKSISQQSQKQEENEMTQIAEINAFRLSHLQQKLKELIANPQKQQTEMLDLKSLVAFIQQGTKETKHFLDLQFLKPLDFDVLSKQQIFLHSSFLLNSQKGDNNKLNSFKEDRETWELIQVKQNKQVLSESKRIQSVLFRAPEGALLVGEVNNQVKIYYPENQDIQPIYKNIGGQLVSAEAITSNYIFLGTNKGQIVILNQLDYSINKVIQVSAKPLQFMSKSVCGEIFVFAFCDQGFIEIIDLTSLNVTQSLRHSSKWGINQAVETSKELEFCLAISEQNNQIFTQGMIGFIILEFSKEQNTFNLMELVDETYKEKEQDQIILRPVFNVQEIMQNIFVFTTNLPYFMFYNRTLKQVTFKVFNPSESINYNSLQRACIFSNTNPYLIYKDSRSVGFINVVTKEAQKLIDVPYRRHGNQYSMHQDMSFLEDNQISGLNENKTTDSLRILALFVNNDSPDNGEPDRGIYTINVDFSCE